MTYEIFSQSKTPKVMFRDYMASVKGLKDLMYSETFDPSRRHLDTELAFCHVKQMEMDHLLLQQGRSYVNEQERMTKKFDLIKELPLATQKLVQVGFLFEAIKLN